MKLRFRFSLKVLLVLVTLVAMAMGTGVQFVFWVKRGAQRYRSAVERLEAFGYSARPDSKAAKMEKPSWLVSLSRKWIDGDAFPLPVDVHMGNELMSAAEARERLTVLHEFEEVASLTVFPDVLDEEFVRLLGQLKQLRDLEIMARQLDGSAGPWIRELVALTRLTIEEPIDDAMLSWLGKAPNLEQLAIDLSQLTNQSIAGAEGFPKLWNFTPLGDVRDPGPLGAMLQNESIVDLNLSMGVFSANALVALENARSVTSLQVGADQGNEELFMHVAKLEKLDKIHAYGLRPAHLKHIGELARCKELTEMTLTGVRLSASDFAQLQSLKQLKSLHLEGTVPSEAMESYLKVVPHCKVRVYSARDQWKEFKMGEGKVESWER
jgi:hypothetical protein